MCGIAGILGASEPQTLSAMAAALGHRGPDGEGIFYDAKQGIGLVHRRLAIIDLSNNAAQPMSAVEGRYQVAFNGEIYNYRALAAELRAEGYHLNSSSDTAVLGPLYHRYGSKMLDKLNGIFALAIWDCLTATLFLARDHAGIKPLYYMRTVSGLSFASELKALLVVPDIDLSVNEAAIADYLTNLWSPGEATPLKSVRKLLPGGMIHCSTSRLEISRWTSPHIGGLTHPPSSAASAAMNLQKLLGEVVRDQCLSDVPVGAFLSGGLDSSVIVAEMVRNGCSPTQTYCIGFDGPSMAAEGFGDDLPYARLVAAQLGVPLTPVIVSAPSPEELQNLAWMLDEPQADVAPLYIAAISARARADGIKVLLGGTGGDDVFSGYRRHMAAALHGQIGRVVSLAADLLVRPGSQESNRGRRLHRFLSLMKTSPDSFLSECFAFNDRSLALKCLSAEARAACMTVEPNSYWLGAIEASRTANLVERTLFLEQFGFLPDHNLNYTDKAAMAYGVEVRVPFLDPRILEFAAHLPTRFKLNGITTKWILRRAMRGSLPPTVISRSKTGLGGPVRHWMRGTSGRLRPFFCDIVASRKFRERGLFDPDAVDALLRGTMDGIHDNAYLVFAIVMVELWMNAFVDSPPRGRNSPGRISE